MSNTYIPEQVDLTVTFRILRLGVWNLENLWTFNLAVDSTFSMTYSRIASARQFCKSAYLLPNMLEYTWNIAAVEIDHDVYIFLLYFFF